MHERIKAQGKDPNDPATMREVYEGTFRRIMASHPLDYYWIWTPEGWTWDGNRPEQYCRSLAQLRCALAKPDADELARLYADVYRYLLATVNTPGALAMVVNHCPDPTHAACTRRSPAVESPHSGQPASSVRAVLWRPLGVGPFRAMPLQHVTRAVYQVELPSPGEDFEYRIEATTAGGTNLTWPATAPEINQTVLLWKD